MTEQPPPLEPSSTATVDAAAAPRPRTRRRLVGAVGAVLLILIVASIVMAGSEPAPSHYISLSMLLFVIGAFGVLVRRNAIVLFMCIELMLNAVNLAFATFARTFADTGGVDGHVVVLFVIIVAAAEVAIGLAIIVSIFRRRASANVDDLSLLRW